MRRFEWKSEPPAECPFPQSESLSRIIFTGQSSDYYVADTWYPSWADDGNLYSGYTDGMVDSIFSCSDAAALSTIPATKNYPTASTGNGVLIGNDPFNLQIQHLMVDVTRQAGWSIMASGIMEPIVSGLTGRQKWDPWFIIGLTWDHLSVSGFQRIMGEHGPIVHTLQRLLCSTKTACAGIR